MFTWIPIHEETATRLLEFKDRQAELIEMLARMRNQGLLTSSITDKDANDNQFQLKEIDAFTFLANFNKAHTPDNRRALWQFLKDEWKLVSKVPADFEGLPVADFRSSWLMPFAANREPLHVELLWRFYEQMFHADVKTLDVALMQQCLDLRKVGLAILTMGMFWACPKRWIATDSKNLDFARTKRVKEKPKSAADYVAWLPRIHKAIGGDGVEFSWQAHEYWKKKNGIKDGRKPPQKDGKAIPPIPDAPNTSYTKTNALKDLFMPEEHVDRAIAMLNRKKNVILQGAPGTGKTFVARRLAYLLMGEADPGRAPMVQFHQSTAYEDFIQGYRPGENGGFEMKNGIFHEFCSKAAEDEQGRPFVFIIDEINRGNLSKIFGEIMMLIESDKRGGDYAVPLAYATSQDETFHVPDNVFLIGTMNTADRSLSLVDYALRRRFAFLDMAPGFSSPVFESHLLDCGVNPRLLAAIRERMTAVNDMIERDTHNLGKGYRIGHSFFVPGSGVTPDSRWYFDVIHHEILPLLGEYWVDDEKSLMTSEQILLAGIPE